LCPKTGGSRRPGEVSLGVAADAKPIALFICTRQPRLDPAIDSSLTFPGARDRFGDAESVWGVGSGRLLSRDSDHELLAASGDLPA